LTWVWGGGTDWVWSLGRGRVIVETVFL